MSFSEKHIKKCRDNDPQAQKALYEFFAPKMFGICMRYANNIEDAEDILQEGFVKVFRDIRHFRGEGSFEGWMKTIMINHAITKYRLKKMKYEHLNENVFIENDTSENIISKINSEEIIKQIQQLPANFRTILNLYIIEGYSHNEISEILDITENASRVILSRARAYFQNLLLKNKYYESTAI